MIDVDNCNDKIITVKYVSDSCPRYQTIGAAGCDIVASENVTIPTHGWSLIPTGLFLEIPKGYECQVRSRSGLAAKEGVFVLNGPGTIDSDYRGEIKVILANMGKNDFNVCKGDRIAQLVFAPVTSVIFQKSTLDDLGSSKRNHGGFGSTGI